MIHADFAADVAREQRELDNRDWTPPGRGGRQASPVLYHQARDRELAQRAVRAHEVRFTRPAWWHSTPFLVAAVVLVAAWVVALAYGAERIFG